MRRRSGRDRHRSKPSENMNRFVDIHHHILYGLDDGPRTYEEMTAMLRLAAAEGIGAIIATPHVTPGLEPVNDALMERRLSEARAYCLDSGLDLRIFPGAEVLYTPTLENLASQGRVPPLAGTRYVLLEFKRRAKFGEIESAVRLLLNGGYIPILAHIERYSCLTRNLPRLKRLKTKCAFLCQMNCAALTGGVFSRWSARRLLRRGLIDFAATDAHNGSTRVCSMCAFHRAVEAFAGEELAKALTARNAEKCFFQ